MGESRFNPAAPGAGAQPTSLRSPWCPRGGGRASPFSQHAEQEGRGVLGPDAPQHRRPPRGTALWGREPLPRAWQGSSGIPGLSPTRCEVHPRTPPPLPWELKVTPGQSPRLRSAAPLDTEDPLPAARAGPTGRKCPPRRPASSCGHCLLPAEEEGCSQTQRCGCRVTAARAWEREAG